MASLSVFYEFRANLGGCSFKNVLHLREWEEDYVLDLRNGIWQTSKTHFSAFHDVKSSEDLLLWKEGQCMVIDDELNVIFSGCGKKVFVTVTPLEAGGSDTPFVQTIPAVDGVEAVLVTLQSLATGIQNLTTDMKQVAAGMKHVMAVSNMLIMMKIEVERWKDESASKVSNHFDFKRRVIEFYDSRRDQFFIRCMITGKYLAQECVIAGHILEVKLKKLGDMLLHIDIDNPRNDILWCKPLKLAWSKNKFCFALSPKEDTFLFLLLDEELKDKKLATYCSEFSKAKDLPQTVQNTLGELSFGDLHMKTMEFPPHIKHRPYKPALAFMSELRKLWAADEGLKPMFEQQEHNFEYWCPGPSREVVLTWLRTLEVDAHQALEEHHDASTGALQKGLAAALTDCGDMTTEQG